MPKSDHRIIEYQSKCYEELAPFEIESDFDCLTSHIRQPQEIINTTHIQILYQHMNQIHMQYIYQFQISLKTRLMKLIYNHIIYTDDIRLLKSV